MNYSSEVNKVCFVLDLMYIVNTRSTNCIRLLFLPNIVFFKLSFITFLSFFIESAELNVSVFVFRSVAGKL